MVFEGRIWQLFNRKTSIFVLMKEASRVKFYLVKFFFLGIALLQVSAATLVFTRNPQNPKTVAVSFILFALCLIFVSLHLLVANKIKKVAVSKKKISVVDAGNVRSYDWADVKEVKYLPLVNMYRVAFKKRKSRVYFLPPTNGKSLFGNFSVKQDFVPKKVGKT